MREGNLVRRTPEGLLVLEGHDHIPIVVPGNEIPFVADSARCIAANHVPSPAVVLGEFCESVVDGHPRILDGAETAFFFPRANVFRHFRASNSRYKAR